MTMADPVTLSVHRCRFVDFNPAAITALAFPPLNLPLVNPVNKGKAKHVPAYSTARFGTLAVGRANGNIEIYEWTGGPGENQAPQAWAVRKVRPCSLH
jgi:U3 small nucleolar RNA-associated protein 4